MSLKNNYPTIMPSLAMDFVNCTVLSPSVTFSRSSIATRVNSVGLIETVGNNVPRFDYDPVTLTPKGLLIEESRTNLFLQSQFASGWLTNGATTSFGAGTTSPDGTLTAVPIIDTSSSLGGYVYQNISFTSGQSYCMSVYVKQGSCTLFYIQSFTQAGSARFNLTTGTVSALSGIASSPNIIPVGSGWYRCSVIFTANATAGCNVGFGDYDGINTGTLFTLWGAQLEQGSFPTSYIPTTSAQVTRTADNASMTGTNFSSWYNQSEGTVAVEASFSTLSSISNIYTISDGTSAKFIRTAGWNDGVSDRSLTVRYDTVDQANMAGLCTIGNQKYAVCFKLNDFAAAKNGNIVGQDTTGLLPIVNQINLGSFLVSALYLNGHIKSFKYYPQRLSNAQLQTLSK